MFVVRPVRLDDLDGLMELAHKTGTGLTTLPAHRPALQEKIEDSITAFSLPEGSSDKHGYLLVLEDTEKGKIAGTSALIVNVGLDKPFYSYRILHQAQLSKEPEMRVDTQLLQLSNDFTGATEMATLFLNPDYHHVGKLGKLLAKARYMLIASHPKRFGEQIIAEIRGWVDENGESPFWEAIGRHFFGMDFTVADEINGRGNSQFISDLMPKHPIYTALLPKEARDVIGRPHDGAAPAKRLLEKEGFHFSGAVDIFDAGPEMVVQKNAIWTARKSVMGALGGCVDGESHDPVHLACNPDLDNFRVTLTNVVEGTSGLWLPSEAASVLELKEGDAMRYAPVDPIKPKAGE
ncbi:arginine N-succinyltransferase [Kordiimonas sp. SCSIO 12603]|uniref:arginine N-succinyltransferase n=1 Tax=Kordiimonas sp. SCSIO 12603 TaxID=2829596 RepID=UPI002102886D|nr:arginine N-succinyltransferase [Kordiimonas sp. SCSIO 12603]UTW60088.1 arginine N-succinyltransferase [Kordiimonas sp. SCSIO 12603]